MQKETIFYNYVNNDTCYHVRSRHTWYISLSYISKLWHAPPHVIPKIKTNNEDL